MTTPQQSAAEARSAAVAALVGRAVAAFRWPFVNRYASPIWFALRLYLGWIWLQFGLTKLQTGWLTSDPVGGMMGAVAKGQIPIPLPFFRDVAQLMIDTGITAPLSHAMPFLEIAVALSFFSGVLVVPAAIGGTLLVINIMLSGMGTLAFDGRIAALQILMILAFRVVSVIGVEKLLVRVVTSLVRKPATAKAATVSQ